LTLRLPCEGCLLQAYGTLQRQRQRQETRQTPQEDRAPRARQGESCREISRDRTIWQAWRTAVLAPNLSAQITQIERTNP